MKKNGIIISLLCLTSILCFSRNQDYRTISAEEYLNKMKAGWLGQMAGVGWGAPTEFKYNGKIIPVDEVPVWQPHMLNQHYQDDIYVEMTFLKTLEDYGLNVSIRQAGIDFANSKYQLWHANKAGRDNLRSGIAPPFSGHPKFNSHADDIDYQIEADFSGLISPGMPQMVIELGNKFGSIMNYGDGIYGGQFVGGMYAEAFFEKDIDKIIAAGLKCIPEDSQYYEAISDVVNWCKQYPDDWERTWELIEEKYNLNPDYRRFSCSGTSSDFNIDAKINGAYIVMGLLYGQGDIDKTIIISMRCGQDSDCNPSNAAGILATSIGYANLPQKYKTNIDDTTNFSFTPYNFPSLVEVCQNLTEEVVIKNGGNVDKNSLGIKEYVIPYRNPEVDEVYQSWHASEIIGEITFSEEEMSKIKIKMRKPEEFVNIWKTAGPYSQAGKEGIDLLDLKFAPEYDENFNKWEKINSKKVIDESGFVNLERIFEKQHSVAYLKTEIFINKSQKARFEIGSDDGIIIYLNGEMVHKNNLYRAHNQAEDIIEVHLKEGWNDILLKISQGEGGWGVSLVITDSKGNALKSMSRK